MCVVQTSLRPSCPTKCLRLWLRRCRNWTSARRLRKRSKVSAAPEILGEKPAWQKNKFAVSDTSLISFVHSLCCGFPTDTQTVMPGTRCKNAGCKTVSVCRVSKGHSTCLTSEKASKPVQTQKGAQDAVFHVPTPHCYKARWRHLVAKTSNNTRHPFNPDVLLSPNPYYFSGKNSPNASLIVSGFVCSELSRSRDRHGGLHPPPWRPRLP